MRESGRVRSTPTRKGQRINNLSLFSFSHENVNDETAKSFMIYKNDIHHEQKHSRRTEEYHKIENQELFHQKRAQFIPSSFKQWDLFKKVNKVGLQNFMKQIVLSNNISNLPISSKLIYAFNKTYLANNVQPHRNYMPTTFGIKRHRASSAQGLNLSQHNPELKISENQIKNGIKGKTHYMFPCRKGQTTKLLKSKQKKKGEAIQQLKKVDFSLNSLEASQMLDQKLRKTISTFDNSKRERQRISSSQLSSYCRPASQQSARQRSRVQAYSQQQYNMVMCKKAFIHQ